MKYLAFTLVLFALTFPAHLKPGYSCITDSECAAVYGSGYGS